MNVALDMAPRGLVGVSWVVQRTGLDRTTVQKAAAQGRIPGATKLLDAWRFDPDLIEAWITAGQPQQTTETARVVEPARPTPKADLQRGQERPIPSAPESTPPLAVIFKNAAHRGINDAPSERTSTRQAGRRRARTTRAAASR